MGVCMYIYMYMYMHAYVHVINPHPSLGSRKDTCTVEPLYKVIPRTPPLIRTLIKTVPRISGVEGFHCLLNALAHCASVYIAPAAGGSHF